MAGNYIYYVPTTVAVTEFFQASVPKRETVRRRELPFFHCRL